MYNLNNDVFLTVIFAYIIIIIILITPGLVNTKNKKQLILATIVLMITFVQF